jgi:chaperone modulatory protein CbpM
MSDPSPSQNPAHPIRPIRVVAQEAYELTLGDVSRTCAVRTEFVLELIEEGAIVPQSGSSAESWRFDSHHVQQLRVASRLQADLGVNPAGAALALQLLDEIESLRAHLPRRS